MKKVCMAVDPGICGFPCRIKSWQKEKRIAGFKILDSHCDMIKKFSTLIDEVTMKDLFLPITRNPIFLSAERAGCHLACPVPVAIVKSLEVALGLAISKDVSIQFDTGKLEPVNERHAKGDAPVLIEIICERVHCVMYDYAINTVDMVAEKFGDQIEIQTVVRQGGLKNAERFMALCKKAGKMLSVPTILINGDVIFTTIPLPDELTATIESYLKKEGDS